MTVREKLTAERWFAAWCGTVAAFRDPDSAERRAIAGALLAASGLSPAGLDAGLEAVLGGVGGAPARAVFAAARAPARAAAAEPVLVVLAGNLPGLVVQPLLPILALGRPAVIKPASTEPVFTPAFVAALVAREPALGALVSVVPWRGGDEATEAAILARVGVVLAYGDEEATTSLARRAPGRTIVYGPKTSLAVVGADARDLDAVAAGLARDVALFDQRGCLSVTTVFVARGREHALADALAEALARRAEEWPPGPTAPATGAAVQRLRTTADLAGWYRPELALAAGTVVVVPSSEPLTPGPGARTVRLVPVAELAVVAALLAPWRGRLQGAALAGRDAWNLASGLAALGVSRLAEPGELQRADASWHNGGVDPLVALTSWPTPRR